MDFRQGSQEPNTETALYTIQFRKIIWITNWLDGSLASNRAKM
ncbi:hypothetical protein QUH73_14150 [Labilibaculum sp. K2S]|nr:hypothetical protein [Labilibaculum sp. K2S]